MTCSGFQGLKTIHPARFARAFTARGYTCFGFDDRGYGTSEGESGTVDEFIRDIANALSSLSVHPAARDRKIVLMGWGMGAGMILEASRVAPCIAALVAMNGFYGHTEWMLDEHPTFQALVQTIDEWLNGLSWGSR